jgi:hypothetical protein
MANDKYKIRYQDKWLILLGVPLINLVNYYLTYPEADFSKHFLIIYSIDTLQGYTAWYACRTVIYFLDRYYPWERNLLWRIILQVPMVCVTLVAVIIGSTELVNVVTAERPMPEILRPFDVDIFLIWGFFLNVLYLSLYLYNRLITPVG